MMGNITFKITEAKLGTEQILNECQLLLAEKGTWGANSKAGGKNLARAGTITCQGPAPQFSMSLCPCAREVPTYFEVEGPGS